MFPPSCLAAAGLNVQSRHQRANPSCCSGIGTCPAIGRGRRPPRRGAASRKSKRPSRTISGSAVIIAVCNEDLAGWADRYTTRRIELAVSNPISAELCQISAVVVKLLDAVVACIGDVDLSVGTDKYIVWKSELTIPAPISAELCQISATAIKLLYAVVAAIGYVDLAAGTDRYAIWKNSTGRPHSHKCRILTKILRSC